MKVIYTDRHHRHATANNIPGCPFVFREIPERADRILDALHAYPRMPPVEHGLDALLRVHSADYLEYLKSAYREKQSFIADGLPVLPEAFALRNAHRKPATFPGIAGWYAYDNAAPIFEATWTAALDSARCALTAADLVYSGEPTVFALCRPPGHHSGKDFAGGYCYLNNAALAARHLQAKSEARIAIIDIDYHHGNGTQEIFYSDPTVFYVSLHADTRHEYPFFWGSEQEVGEGAGTGYNLNINLPDETDDDAYLAALNHALDRIRDFKPEYLIVSAGFDLMQGDPEVLGMGFSITVPGLVEIGRRLRRLRLPTVILQEGGYNIDRIGEYTTAFVAQFD